MPQVSAGLLMYRLSAEGMVEFYLVHPGGPYFARRDDGWWTIPKGLVESGESAEVAARREFAEETGIHPVGELIALGEVRQKGGKRVMAWAFRWPRDETPELKSNTFEIEWPPRSGRKMVFPEADRGQFFAEHEARIKINAAQSVLIDRLKEALNHEPA